MRSLRPISHVFAVLAGIAAISIAASGGSAFAARPVPAARSASMKADGPQTYDSACAAKPLTPKSPISAPATYSARVSALRIITAPLCGMDPLNHARMTYPNNCAAENARAIWIHDGPCKK